jgi:hypothetical protein
MAETAFLPAIPGGTPEQIDYSRLCEQDYLLASMLPIFATAMAPYAGKMLNPRVWIQNGMRKVFDWWCQAGVSCGEPDMVDAAADVAWLTAAHVWNDPDTLMEAFEALLPYMVSKIESCTGRQAATITQLPSP